MCSIRVLTSFLLCSLRTKDLLKAWLLLEMFFFLPLCVNHHVSSAVFHGFKQQHRHSDVLSRDYSDYPEMCHKIDILTLPRFSYLVLSNGFMTVGKKKHTGSLETDRDSDRRALFQEEASFLGCTWRMLISRPIFEIHEFKGELLLTLLYY